MSFAHQLLPLRDAELVLFIDNDQPETIHFKIRLEERMSADHKPRAAPLSVSSRRDQALLLWRRIMGFLASIAPPNATLDLGELTLDLIRLVRSSLQTHAHPKRMEPSL